MHDTQVSVKVAGSQKSELQRMQHGVECGSKRTSSTASQPTVNKNAVKQVFLWISFFYAKETNLMVSKNNRRLPEECY